MARWSRTLLALAATVLLAVPSAFAQGGGASSTGSISGDVKDEQGGVLPGVTVTATSPAQPGALTAVTNEAGIYRFPAVPPGVYALGYELAGFGAVTRDGIRITLGFDARVNVTLGVANLQESVTVSGQSPVIDTSATRLQTNYDQERLASIPNARDMWSLLATTPSVTLNRVDVGGATMGTQTTYFAYGYSGQNRPLVEGINTTEGTSAAGFYLDYGSFEEVFIGAAAASQSGIWRAGTSAVLVKRTGRLTRWTNAAITSWTRERSARAHDRLEKATAKSARQRTAGTSACQRGENRAPSSRARRTTASACSSSRSTSARSLPARSAWWLAGVLSIRGRKPVWRSRIQPMPACEAPKSTVIAHTPGARKSRYDTDSGRSARV
jgi:hypothetical protein